MAHLAFLALETGPVEERVLRGSMAGEEGKNGTKFVRGTAMDCGHRTHLFYGAVDADVGVRVAVG